jgi:hypothetical protein
MASLKFSSSKTTSNSRTNVWKWKRISSHWRSTCIVINQHTNQIFSFHEFVPTMFRISIDRRSNSTSSRGTFTSGANLYSWKKISSQIPCTSIGINLYENQIFSSQKLAPHLIRMPFVRGSNFTSSRRSFTSGTNF